MTAIARLIGALATSSLLVGGCAGPTGLTHARRRLAIGDYPAVAGWLANATARGGGENREVLELAMRLALARDQPTEAVRHYRSRPQAAQRLALSRATIWAALRDRRPAVRLAAIQLARSLNAGELAPEMQRRLSDPEPRVAVWAAVALSATAPGAQALQHHVHEGPSEVRATALRESARLAGPSGLSLVLRCERATSPLLRVACADALVFVKARSGALPALRKLLADPLPQVRRAALRAAGALRLTGLAADVEERLSDPEANVRHAAISAFALIGAPERARLRLSALVYGPDGADGAIAAGFLERLGQIQLALNGVARGLVDRRWNVRVLAINTASMLKDPVAWQLCERSFGDPHPAVRLAAIRLAATKRLFVRQATSSARTMLKAGCGRATPLSRCAETAAAACRLGVQGALAQLERLMTTRSTQVPLRSAALRAALACATNKPHIALMGQADPAPLVRLIAAEYLYRANR